MIIRLLLMKRKFSWFTAMLLVILYGLACIDSKKNSPDEAVPEAGKWEIIGKRAATESLILMKKMGAVPEKENLIVLTNAGYAVIGEASTEAALDGLTYVTEASRGRNTLIEIHSAFWAPLWFAVYDKKSGICAYLEVDSNIDQRTDYLSTMMFSELFSLHAVETIQADYLYAHASDFKNTFENKPFGGNEFRIISIANAVAAGVPGYALRALEFHDHFCPGIVSGILLANYLKKYFSPEPGGAYFVHSVDPWCKEDALMVMLNTTPGKKSYALSYPTAVDKTEWIPEVQNASTIVYRRKHNSKTWDGLVLAFEWPDIESPEFTDDTIDKLYRALLYLDHIDTPEDLVKVLKSFELPEGVSPRDWARPGPDPFNVIGLTRQ